MNEQNKTARPRGTDSAKVIQVIVTDDFVGYGTNEDPCRMVKKYWSFNGELLAVQDECLDHFRSIERASSNVSSESI